jgi:hypothetical protein
MITFIETSSIPVLALTLIRMTRGLDDSRNFEQILLEMA